ncbi:3-dehydroquinate synthase [Alteribacillus iranensis]|uniref:3-dehydroquinate synthase n=1 Tax=Alteribacillus iranensis TaxID=930128 RepID=A0A1I1ZTP2_9BACI|nr:3-dehydroquinate synthase [Alteribacillus iranensis]SFE33973.1 3-dehydroquinate synthase [Alteribacillus iranensis]
MEELVVTTDHTSYPVFIGEGIRHQCSSLLYDILKERSKVLIITDETVAELYADDVVRSVSNALSAGVCKVPSGETSKSMDVYHKVMTACIQEGLDRQSIIIALGGGVIGDLAGFAAATYMRGIPFIQMPTTLLAQDSSVGGKTGINHELGKNLIGAFHQPAAVLYDTETLHTLPDKEWRSGFAEMIKHAYIKDPEFLTWLKENVHSLEDIKDSQLLRFLKRSIAIKAEIVKEDEKESGVRAFLNFGHTLGHAVEKESGYGGMTHGEAVAAGMIFAMKVSNRLGYSKWDVTQEAEWLKALGYPIEAPSQYSSHQLIEVMKNDKKASKGNITFVLLEKPGSPFLETVDERTLAHILEETKEGGVI